MTKAWSWILISLTLTIGGFEHHTALGIADQHLNVAKGKNIYRSDVQDIIYDQKHLVDGKDYTTSYLYFPKTLTICIDLGDSFTVRHVLIKISPDSFKELKKVEAKLSYAPQPGQPTLTHVFSANGCAQTKKHETNLFLISLYRCCGRCCGWKLRGIGRFLNVTFEKKSENNQAFGVHEVEVHGLKTPPGLNLALFKPVLEEHDTTCRMSPFVVNDAWMDDLFVQVKRPPFRWRVDLGKAEQLGIVRIVYKGKWGSAKLILMDDHGVEYPDDLCPLFRMEVHQKNTICCNTAGISTASRWLEIRGGRSLPQLVEVFAYPRNFRLHLEECPTGTTSTSTTLTAASMKSETTTQLKDLLKSTEKPVNRTATYATSPISSASQQHCKTRTFYPLLFSAILAIYHEVM